MGLMWPQMSRAMDQLIYSQGCVLVVESLRSTENVTVDGGIDVSPWRQIFGRAILGFWLKNRILIFQR